MFKFRSSPFILFALLAAALIHKSCVSHDFPTYICPDEPVSYAQDVRPIVTNKCAVSGCHSFDPNLPDWTDFETFQEGALQGHVREYVLNRIMPPDESPAGPLSQEQINTIVCWIDQGAPNN